MKIIFLFILLTTSILAQAGIYKWIDKNGNTHYGQSPPDNSSKQMDLPSASISPERREANKERTENLQKFLRALDEDKKAQEQLDQEEERKIQQKKDYERYCKELRHELRDMETGGIAWYELDDKGERKYFSDEEIAQQKQNLREKFKNECEN